MRALADRLADLDMGAPSAVDHAGATGAGGAPDRLRRLEALAAHGAAMRAREAHRLVSALPAEHRPAARWLAASAPASRAADSWPALLARAIGPRELAAAADETAGRESAARLSVRAAQAAVRRGVTHEVARALNAARSAQASAAAASAAAAADLDMWGRVRLAALLTAVGDPCRRPKRPRGAGGLPFLNTFRTLCLAPDPTSRGLFEAVREVTAL